MVHPLPTSAKNSSALVHWKRSYSMSTVSMFLSSVQKWASNKEPILSFVSHSEKCLPKRFSICKKFIVMMVYLVADFMSGIQIREDIHT